MRSKRRERERAIALRQRGLSYSEIRRRVPVAKSSLSVWLRQVGLLEWQRQRLRERKAAPWRKGPQKRHELRLQRIARVNADARQEARRLLRRREIRWLVGTSLYWAEGTKIKAWRAGEQVAFVNSDPAMVNIIQDWLRRYCAVVDSDVDFYLYIHEKANISAAHEFWVRSLRIDRGRLRTYLKKHNPSPKRHNIGASYYGTMRVRIRKSTDLSHRIAAWVRELIDWCGVG
jgi:hypothetical protein